MSDRLCKYARFKRSRYCGEARHGGYRHWDVVEGDLILYKEHYEGGTYGHRLARVLGLATHDGCGKEYTETNAKGKVKKAPRLMVLAASDMLDFGYERHIELSNVEEVMWRGADRDRAFARWFLFGLMPSPELAAAVCDYGAMSDGYLAKYLTAPEGELRKDWREVHRVRDDEKKAG